MTDAKDTAALPIVDGEPSGMVGGRHLPTSIAVGVGLAILLLGSLFWHPAAFSIFIGVLLVVGLIEASRTFASVGYRSALPVLLVAALVMLVGAYRWGSDGQVAGLVVLFVGAALWELRDHHREYVVRRLGATITMGLWVPFLASFGVLLVAHAQDGDQAVLAVILGAIFGDIGGFAFGVRFGRHKVAPSVSPAKSWEGLIGGLALAAVVSAIFVPLAGDNVTVLQAAILGAACALAGFIGDLVESMIKRDIGVKDLGNLLPGHGGILDRVDGVLMALPVGYYLLRMFGA